MGSSARPSRPRAHRCPTLPWTTPQPPYRRTPASAKLPREDTFTWIGGFSMGRFRSSPFALPIAALALSLAAAARAEITPEAKKVVDRYVEATGGGAARLAVHSLRAKASV